MLEQMTAKWDADERDKFERQAEAQRDQFWRGLRDAGLWQHLSPREQEHAQSTMATMTGRQQVDASWRMEAAQTLMWALGMLPDLPPYDTMASHDLLKQIPSRDVAPFIQSARLRDQAELDAARDAAEFWHWRSRTRELIERGDAFPDDPKMKAAGFHSYDDIVRFSARKAAEDGTRPPCVGDASVSNVVKLAVVLPVLSRWPHEPVCAGVALGLPTADGGVGSARFVDGVVHFVRRRGIS